MNEHNVSHVPHWPVMRVSYDDNNNQFVVKSLETLCGYFVPRGDLVDSIHRNSGSVLSQILEGCENYLPFSESSKMIFINYGTSTPNPVFVFLAPEAEKEIQLIWEANVMLFP